MRPARCLAIADALAAGCSRLSSLSSRGRTALGSGALHSSPLEVLGTRATSLAQVRPLHASSAPLLQQQQQAAASSPSDSPLPHPGLAPSSDLKLDELIMTVRAAKRINAVRAKAVADGKADVAAPFHLRVKVEGGGCSGFRYEFNFETTPPGPEDIIFEREGARVVTDAVSLDFIKGSTLEWEDSMMRSAFSIANNPNAESSCGCKSSFAPKQAKE